MLTADLRSLGLGEHHLVFVGQTSQHIAVIAITVTSIADDTAAKSELAGTGSAIAGPLGIAALLLLLGTELVLIPPRLWRRRIAAPPRQ